MNAFRLIEKQGHSQRWCHSHLHSMDMANEAQYQYIYMLVFISMCHYIPQVLDKAGALDYHTDELLKFRKMLRRHPQLDWLIGDQRNKFKVSSLRYSYCHPHIEVITN